jgi:tetratricopeptide (TPR) repeat protein
MPDTAAYRKLLESERKAEQQFVEEARHSESSPKGWPAALVMFHMGMWRERLRNALSNVSEGKDYERPAGSIDEINDADLAMGIGTPLNDAAARADHLLAEIIDLYEKLGERPLEWVVAKTTTEAVLRNSYVHPRVHMFEYCRENGDTDRARRLFEEAVEEMRAASAPPLVMGAVLYNLAGVRASEGQTDEALALLKEAFPIRPDLKAAASDDAHLADLRQDPRFQELVEPQS